MRSAPAVAGRSGDASTSSETRSVGSVGGGAPNDARTNRSTGSLDAPAARKTATGVRSVHGGAAQVGATGIAGTDDQSATLPSIEIATCGRKQPLDEERRAWPGAQAERSELGSEPMPRLHAARS